MNFFNTYFIAVLLSLGSAVLFLTLWLLERRKSCSLRKSLDSIEKEKNKLYYKDLSVSDILKIFRAILDNISCSIFVKNFTKDDIFVIVNKFLKNSMNNDADWEGKTDFDFFNKETAINFIEGDKFAVDQVMNTGSVDFNRTEDLISLDDEKKRTGQTRKTVIKGADGDLYIVGLINDATELILAQDQRDTLLTHEKIINNCLRLAFSSNDEKIVINSILKAICEPLNADRSYIFEYNYDTGLVDNTAEWCAEGISPQIHKLQNVPFDTLTEWTTLFNEQKSVIINNLAVDATRETRDTKETLEMQGIQTLLAVGIMSGGRLWGFIGLDFVKSIHIFTDFDQNMLDSAAKIIELFLDRRQALKILEYNEAAKSLMLDSIHIPILMYDRTGALSRANSAAEKIMPSGKISLEKDAAELEYGENHTHVLKCLSTAKPVEYEIKMGKREYYNFANPVFNSDGEVINVIVSFIDMTDFNEGKRQLLEAMEAAKEADRAKGAFLATVSHELRTPLNAVIGYSELSQSDDITQEERLENLKSINISANSLLGLINDVLDISKLDANRIEIFKTAVDVHDINDELLSIFKFRVEKQGIYLKINAADGIPILMLDSSRLKQIAINVLGNAVKFTDKGGVTLDVSFDTYADNPQAGILKVKITDTGMGISPEYTSKIFEPFERQPLAVVRGNNAYEGTGLGLSISYKLAKEMGGDITVTSELGKGSTFTITIPADIAKDTPAQQEKPAQKKEKKSADRLVGKKVLIVDDIEMNLNVLGAMLSKIGVKTVKTLSAKEALEIAKKEKPDLIMTDLWMPEMDGLDLAKAIRQEKDLDYLPIVMVTADAQTENPDNIFTRILLKPITVAKINEIIEDVL